MTRSNRTTGRFRSYKGSGPIGRLSFYRRPRRRPYWQQPAIKRRVANGFVMMPAGGQNGGPHPHPTKKGPGRY